LLQRARQAKYPPAFRALKNFYQLQIESHLDPATKTRVKDLQPKDYDKCVLGQEAMKAGDVLVAMDIARCSGVNALATYESAALAGDRWAAFNVADDFLRGHDTAERVDYKKAAKYFELAAKADVAMAAEYLGNMYFNGVGVEQSFEKAAPYIEQAAAGGESLAQFQLGLMYFRGLGKPIDLPKAQHWWQKSVHHYHRDGMAPLALAIFYLEGHGKLWLDEDRRHQALELLHASAKTGNAKALELLKQLEGGGTWSEALTPFARDLAVNILADLAIMAFKAGVNKLR
jgi:TPR repeat protein